MSTKISILAYKRSLSPYIIGALCILSASSCVDQGQDMSISGNTTEQVAPEGSGSIAIQLEGKASITRGSMTSVITQEEANLFLVTIYKGSEFISQQIQLGSVGTVSFPAGYGYKVSVENITAEQAITLNDGWGAKRYTGESQSFGIVAGQTTRVAVPCSTANAAVAVNIDTTIENCKVTITTADGRVLATTENRTAYVNIPQEGTAMVSITVEKNGEIVGESTDLELESSQVKDINVRPKDDNETNVGLDITYEDSFEQTLIGVTLPLE